MRIADSIRAASAQLEATSDTERLDAELLMAHALGVTRSDMLLRHMQDVSPDAFDPLVARRAAHEPVAYITGVQEFYGRPFAVTPDTLIPRGDTETLIDVAIEIAPDAKRVLDLGTGSGALLITALLELEGTSGIATDCSAAALKIAQSNALNLGLGEHQAQFLLRDWTKEHWSEGLGVFDLILSNPPYVEEEAKLRQDVRDFEPTTALFSGREGLDDYRVLIPQLRLLMSDGGVAILEIGATQAEAVTGIAKENGFEVHLRKDLAGRARALILR